MIEAYPRRWQFFIDRGGTFTDIIARRPDGTIATKKLLSENPEHYKDAALEGIRAFLNLAPDAIIPARLVRSIKMGTTVATNALLERRGAPTALITSRGFGDILRIASQQRPSLFALDIVKPEQLYCESVEVAERVAVDGTIITPLNEAAVTATLTDIYQRGIRSLAVVFVHGFRYPDHEQRVGQIARTIGFSNIALSHLISPTIKIVGRGDTTVISAYLSPILRHYVEQVAAALEPGIELLFMQSDGGLTSADFFYGHSSLLSGPAGGVIGAVAAARAAGFQKMLSFDMGGTSTDTAHYNAETASAADNDDGYPLYETSFETTVAGARVRVPMMRLETLAAGGGSICQFDGRVMTVGPGSAGANPGPACYGRGGPLTITDCHVLLGRVRPEFFGHIFGPGRDQPLDKNIVIEKFDALSKTIGKTPAAIANGFLAIANEKMAQGIKKISVALGHDITDHLLVAFGGGGGQHVCQVAEALEIKQALLHPLAGVLSAMGIGLAPITARGEKTIGLLLVPQNMAAVQAELATLQHTVLADLTAQGINQPYFSYQLHCRYQGSDATLPITIHKPTAGLDVVTIAQNFEQAHLKQFGFLQNEQAGNTATPVMVEMITVQGRGHHDDTAQQGNHHDKNQEQSAKHHPPAFIMAEETITATTSDISLYLDDEIG
ncbi:MAG: hydantoinase/oxoprolinase family protein, partial [Alphaproteobacteria bacterium]|nr:hydantoinase/oxoprolinase family protein [Alphaproteobacteria bacterium]